MLNQTGFNSDNAFYIYNETLPNFEDLAATESDGTSRLYCWNQTTYPQENCTFWVNFPVANSSYYLYWNKPDAVNEWDQTNTFEDVVDGVVLGLPMDEGSGDTVYDQSGQDNNGTITGASWVDGKYGKALSFDGTNNYVKIPDAPILDLTNAFSIEAWVNLTTYLNSFVYSSADGAALNGFSLDLRNGRLYLLLRNASTYQDFSGVAVVPLTTWTHIVATYDASTNTYAFYVNGILDVSGAVTIDITANADDKCIGKASWATDYLTGIIDEVRIYNQALTSTEIGSTYNNYGDSTLDAGKVLVRVWADSSVTLWGTVETIVEISGETALAVGFIFALIAMALAVAAFTHRR